MRPATDHHEPTKAYLPIVIVISISTTPAPASVTPETPAKPNRNAYMREYQAHRRALRQATKALAQAAAVANRMKRKRFFKGHPPKPDGWDDQVAAAVAAVEVAEAHVATLKADRRPYTQPTPASTTPEPADDKLEARRAYHRRYRALRKAKQDAAADADRAHFMMRRRFLKRNPKPADWVDQIKRAVAKAEASAALVQELQQQHKENRS